MVGPTVPHISFTTSSLSAPGNDHRQCARSQLFPRVLRPERRRVQHSPRIRHHARLLQRPGPPNGELRDRRPMAYILRPDAQFQCKAHNRGTNIRQATQQIRLHATPAHLATRRHPPERVALLDSFLHDKRHHDLTKLAATKHHLVRNPTLHTPLPRHHPGPDPPQWHQERARAPLATRLLPTPSPRDTRGRCVETCQRLRKVAGDVDRAS